MLYFLRLRRAALKVLASRKKITAAINGFKAIVKKIFIRIFIMPAYYAQDGKFEITQGGKPVAGAKIYAYISGTTTLATTYKNAAQTILNTNPIICDAEGRSVIMTDPAVTYDFEARTPQDTLIKRWNEFRTPGADALVVANSALSVANGATLAVAGAQTTANNATQAVVDLTASLNAWPKASIGNFTAQTNDVVFTTYTIPSGQGGVYQFTGFVGLYDPAAFPGNNSIQSYLSRSINSTTTFSFVISAPQGQTYAAYFSYTENFAAGDVIRFRGQNFQGGSNWRVTRIA